MNPMKDAPRRGFTLADLCVLIAIVVLVAAAMLPSASHLGHGASRAKCSNNLRQIALAAQMYAYAEPDGSFPRTVYDGIGGAPTVYTGVQAPNPFGPGAPGPNDVTAALYLLLRTQEITHDAFICPSSPAERWDFAGRGPMAFSNFPGRQYVSYSYANPFPTKAAVGSGWRFDVRLGSNAPLAGDMNSGMPALLTTPYTASARQMAAVNSPNHNGEGQNVVFCDAHVEWQTTTPYCGVPLKDQPFRDNVYTAGLGTGTVVSGAPTDYPDMVLLPAYGDGPQPPPWKKAKAFPGLIAFIGAGVLLFVAGLIVAILARRSART